MTPAATNLPTEARIEMLRRMMISRAFENRAMEEYDAGRIFGGLHCYNGQEAVAVGVCSVLTHADKIISTHRGHGHCIAKGADINRMFAELFGRVDGYCKGKGGSMHIADFNIGMLGANGIVGGGLSIVTGAGLAAKMDKQGHVAVAFFGDGASNTGPFHESLNIAATWKLPMVYVCENNLYGSSSPLEETTALPDISARAAGYGIPGVIVDGNDIYAVHQAAQAAVARAREGKGPTLIEAKTYRVRPHTEKKTMPDKRPRAEVEAWEKRDPILRLAQGLQAEGELDAAGLSRIEAEVARLIDAAVAFAEASPFPRPEQALEDVFEL